MRNYDFKMSSVKLNAKNLKQYNATIIMTDHDYINYGLIEKNSKIIFDTRGRLKKIKKLFMFSKDKKFITKY